MNDVQLPSTVVADTGTGRLYVAYAQGPDEATWDHQASGLRSVYRVRRTRPIPTPSFAGVDRLNAKLTETLTDSDGNARIGVIEVVTSMPVNVSNAERTEMFLSAYWHLYGTLASPILTGRLPT